MLNSLRHGVVLAMLASAAGAVRHDPPNGPLPSPRMTMNDPVARLALRRAIVGAAGRLERDECRQVLTDFPDRSGRPLTVNLDASGHSASEYLLQHVWFVDDSDAAQCQGGIIAAFTAVGDHVIRICTEGFSATVARNSTTAEFLVIHEMLHTLGLGENPPAPDDITNRVRTRCGR